MIRSLACCLIAAIALTGCSPNDNSSKSAAPKAAFVIPADAKEISVEAVKGDWNVGPKVARIKVDGNLLTVINEKGEPSKGEIKEGKVLLASDWRVYAVLIADGKVLRWSDGSGWTR